MVNGGKIINWVDVNYKSAYNAQNSYSYQGNSETFEEQLLYDQESKSNDMQALHTVVFTSGEQVLTFWMGGSLLLSLWTASRVSTCIATIPEQTDNHLDAGNSVVTIAV